MSFIKSNSIKVFPCGGRNSEFDVAAKLTTEYNLVSIINRLVDQKSFVVSDTVPSITPGSSPSTFTTDFVFNLNGYLFSTTDATFGGLINNENEVKGNYIVAYIYPEGYGNGGAYTQLSPLDATSIDFTTVEYGGILDNNGSFTGVEFGLVGPQSDDDTAVTKTQLPLLQYNGTKWIIPPDSKIKFRTTTDGSSRSVTIDDGELT